MSKPGTLEDQMARRSEEDQHPGSSGIRTHLKPHESIDAPHPTVREGFLHIPEDGHE